MAHLAFGAHDGAEPLRLVEQRVEHAGRDGGRRCLTQRLFRQAGGVGVRAVKHQQAALHGRHDLLHQRGAGEQFFAAAQRDDARGVFHASEGAGDGLFVQAAAVGDLTCRLGGARKLQMRPDGRVHVAGIQRREHRVLFGLQVRATPRAGAENRSAADDVHGGVRAHDELVAVRHGKRLLQANLRERAAFGVQGLEAVHEQDAPEDLARAVGHVNARARLQGASEREGVEVGELGVEAVGQMRRLRCADEVAGANLVGRKPREAHRDAVARRRALG